MPKATNQSNFRSNMKEYMDYVVREGQAVYITRAGNESLVLSPEEEYNLMLDYINSASETLDAALLEYKLFNAGLLKAKNYSSTDDYKRDLFEEKLADEA